MPSLSMGRCPGRGSKPLVSQSAQKMKMRMMTVVTIANISCVFYVPDIIETFQQPYGVNTIIPILQMKKLKQQPLA